MDESDDDTVYDDKVLSILRNKRTISDDQSLNSSSSEEEDEEYYIYDSVQDADKDVKSFSYPRDIVYTPEQIAQAEKDAMGVSKEEKEKILKELEDRPMDNLIEMFLIIMDKNEKLSKYLESFKKALKNTETMKLTRILQEIRLLYFLIPHPLWSLTKNTIKYLNSVLKNKNISLQSKVKGEIEITSSLLSSPPERKPDLENIQKYKEALNEKPNLGKITKKITISPLTKDFKSLSKQEQDKIYKELTSRQWVSPQEKELIESDKEEVLKYFVSEIVDEVKNDKPIVSYINETLVLIQNIYNLLPHPGKSSTKNAIKKLKETLNILKGKKEFKKGEAKKEFEILKKNINSTLDIMSGESNKKVKTEKCLRCCKTIYL